MPKVRRTVSFLSFVAVIKKKKKKKGEHFKTNFMKINFAEFRGKPEETTLNKPEKSLIG